MMANGAKMTRNSAMHRSLCALIVLCTVWTGQAVLNAQRSKGGRASLEDQEDSGAFFLGTSHDERFGALAWLFHLDKAHRTGEMFVAPRMMTFSQFELSQDGTLAFQSPVLLGKEYRFKGTLKPEAISGEMRLVNAKTGDLIDKWELTAAELHPQKARTSSAQEVGNFRYSNAAYSSEGGDQTGVDIRFFTANTGTTGMIVFYESYWGEPTFTPLTLSRIIVKKGTIHFAVELPRGIAHYHLLPTPTAGLFNRDDVPHGKGDKDIVLKKMRAMF